ncbi:hypothetical protein C1S99_17230 [Vibrio parahaemolyticus]|uniref:hypothetical protein n=1 Tax=Vibrio parahaemolyticus TaxID=670 RepID=UPI000530FF06|nr:hypothetical protein [Vibrio parahaemolyticus]EJB8691821.1 hypothetical protein [Vibrio parahaemolyticus]KGT34483.1 hypothetical protein HC02_17370 [Vibrio parahaemolyticus]PMS39170.1 hypothetical protein C1T12_25760 [Vibrio parahaemolyticus]PMS57768.1 hypothetical protein C1S91_25705 [Vibrio parahaemolyticus]PMS65145.1 hypothetical protein C1S96_26535 [Vibrio parahaemolyticus]
MRKFDLDGHASFKNIAAMNNESELTRIGLQFTSAGNYVHGRVNNVNVSNYKGILSIIYRNLKSGSLSGEVILSNGKKKLIQLSKARVLENNVDITSEM